MSNESWTVYTLKFIGWIALRAAADYMISGLRDALNFAEVVKNFYHGDIVRGVINLLYGAVCYGTVGALSVVKDVAGQSIKEAVIHGATRIALTAERKATNEVRKGLVARNLAEEMGDETVKLRCWKCKLPIVLVKSPTQMYPRNISSIAHTTCPSLSSRSRSGTSWWQ